MKLGRKAGLARQGYRYPLFVVLNRENSLVVNRDVEQAGGTMTIEVG
jgi:hypothetical protein